MQNAPSGYDFGSGLFDVAGPLNAGLVFDIGSRRAVSAIGSLVRRTGASIAFVAGTATSEDDLGFGTTAPTQGVLVSRSRASAASAG